MTNAASNGARHAIARHRPGALRNGLFEALGETERRVIEEASTLVEYRRRERIYVPGDPSPHLFLLAAGAVKLSVEGPENREIILSFIHPGDVFGQLEIADRDAHDHVATAYEHSRAYALDTETLRDVMRETPSLAWEVTRLVGGRLQSYRRRVEELLYKSAHARVAHTLHGLAGRHGVRDADGVVIPLRLSQRDIANLVGLTRETVNFILKDLRQRDLIETQGRSIRLREPEILLTVR